LSIEAGVPQGWDHYVGQGGRALGLDRFGGSSPGDVAMRELGFNVENVVQLANQIIARK
jgi:transketolase